MNTISMNEEVSQITDAWDSEFDFDYPVVAEVRFLEELTAFEIRVTADDHVFTRDVDVGRVANDAGAMFECLKRALVEIGIELAIVSPGWDPERAWAWDPT